MKRLFALLPLLLVIGHLAHAQHESPASSVSLVMSLANHHRNPDYQEPLTKRTVEGRKRRTQVDVYMYPFAGNQPASQVPNWGIPVQILPDGRWFMIVPSNLQARPNEPSHPQWYTIPKQYGLLFQDHP